jgi:predicted  nucleic acid-binding Zn ribbon protein
MTRYEVRGRQTATSALPSFQAPAVSRSLQQAKPPCLNAGDAYSDVPLYGNSEDAPHILADAAA